MPRGRCSGSRGHRKGAPRPGWAPSPVSAGGGVGGAELCFTPVDGGLAGSWALGGGGAGGAAGGKGDGGVVVKPAGGGGQDPVLVRVRRAARLMCGLRGTARTMDDWEALRTTALVTVWLTVSGGAVMAAIWFKSGGARSVGPEDGLMADAGVPVERGDRPVTAFTSAQLGIHGLLGILTAALLTYGVRLDDDRRRGYVAILVAIGLTGSLGFIMFRKWRSGQRPRVPGVDVDRRERAEDHLPRIVVYLHGAAAIATGALVLMLLLVD